MNSPSVLSHPLPSSCPVPSRAPRAPRGMLWHLSAEKEPVGARRARGVLSVQFCLPRKGFLGRAAIEQGILRSGAPFRGAGAPCLR